jgi:hypothetical protein
MHLSCHEKKLTYTNGKRTMQKMEKTAWVIDGVLQAQAEFQELVASVTTAMIRAPMLELSAFNLTLIIEVASLVKVIEHTDPP